MKPARSTAPEGPTGKLYEEILDLIAAGTTPAAVIAFRPSIQAQQRVAELIEQSEDGRISPQYQSELEDYLLLEHLMIMAKARARLYLSVG